MSFVQGSNGKDLLQYYAIDQTNTLFRQLSFTSNSNGPEIIFEDGTEIILTHPASKHRPGSGSFTSMAQIRQGNITALKGTLGIEALDYSQERRGFTECVVKTYYANSELIYQFYNNVRQMINLHNIAPFSSPKVFYVGRGENTMLVAMERLNCTVLEHLSKHPQDVNHVVFELSRMVHRLQHSVSFVHRDMHVSNVMVDMDGQWRVIDVDLATIDIQSVLAGDPGILVHNNRLVEIEISLREIVKRALLDRDIVLVAKARALLRKCVSREWQLYDSEDLDALCASLNADRAVVPRWTYHFKQMWPKKIDFEHDMRLFLGSLQLFMHDRVYPSNVPRVFCNIAYADAKNDVKDTLSNVSETQSKEALPVSNPQVKLLSLYDSMYKACDEKRDCFKKNHAYSPESTVMIVLDSIWPLKWKSGS